MRSPGSSFEYRLMQQIQKAIPAITPYIEKDNPAFPGLIITICDPEIEQKVELRISDQELTQWIDSQSLFISRIVSNLQQAHQKLKTHSESRTNVDSQDRPLG